MSLTELPEVAKTVFVHCKKCEADRYHRVLAHTGPRSAKLECEVCKSRKSFTLPSANSKRGAGLVAAAEKKRVAKAQAKKDVYSVEYQGLRDSGKLGNPETYNMKSKFKAESAVNHPKFGIGFIKTVTGEKIEVMFEDEIRSLVHNRQ